LLLTRSLNSFIIYYFKVIQQRNADSLREEPQEVQDAVQRLYAYWAGYWLTIQTPERFSVHGDKTRTNNFIENWNRWFNARCDGHRQNIWDFIGKISSRCTYVFKSLISFFDFVRTS
jgi:hypothetical protein